MVSNSGTTRMRQTSRAVSSAKRPAEFGQQVEAQHIARMLRHRQDEGADGLAGPARRSSRGSVREDRAVRVLPPRCRGSAAGSPEACPVRPAPTATIPACRTRAASSLLSGFSLRQISASTRLMTVVFWRMSRLIERKPKVSTSQRTGRMRLAAPAAPIASAPGFPPLTAAPRSVPPCRGSPVALPLRIERRVEPHPERREKLPERFVLVAAPHVFGIAAQVRPAAAAGRGSPAGKQFPAR